jgi:hypothetical protein
VEEWPSGDIQGMKAKRVGPSADIQGMKAKRVTKWRHMRDDG